MIFFSFASFMTLTHLGRPAVSRERGRVRDFPRASGADRIWKPAMSIGITGSRLLGAYIEDHSQGCRPGRSRGLAERLWGVFGGHPVETLRFRHRLDVKFPPEQLFTDRILA